MSNPEGTTEHVAEPEEKVTNEQKEERSDAGKEDASEGPQDPPPVVVINPILKDNGHAVVVDENERTDPPTPELGPPGAFNFPTCDRWW